LKVDRRIYIDHSGKKLVEGAPDAAELYRPKGGNVSKADLDAWGKELAQYVPEVKDQYMPKKKTQPSKNKMQAPPKNKSKAPEKESD
jgi:hypothetical protein